MPVLPHEPPSSDHERSPSPETQEQRPFVKRPRLTANDLQRRHLERLLANPEKEVRLPPSSTERSMRAPREMMPNVSGSSTAAGSGEFHVYKHSRRREYERVKLMDEKDRALAEQKAFMARQAEREAASEAKTAKNRAKRLKRKAGRKGGSGDATSGNPKPATADSGSKLAGGAGHVVFRRPGEEAESEDDDAGPVPEQASAEPAAPAALPSAEVEITVHDED